MSRLMKIFLLGVLLTPLMAHSASVLDFGAKGDGVADDTLAIQRALDAEKGPVALPHGEYLITQSLYLPSGGGIVGEGVLHQVSDKTTLLCATGEETVRDILIEGVTIKKKFVDNSVEDGIRLENARDVRVRGVEVTGVSAVVGIYLVGCENFSITDCYIHDFILSATYRPLPGGRGPDALGISVKNCSFGQITGNRIENLNVTEESANALAYQTDGINPHSSKHVAIANNTVRNVGEGLDLVNCESFTVTGNTFEDCWHFGIKMIHGTRYCTVAHNTIKNAALAGMTLYFGNSDFGPSFGNVVQGNTIVNTGSLQWGSDSSVRGVWSGWLVAGIEIVNDNKPTNSVFDYVISDNVIYDDQEEPTCKYGIIERYITFDRVGPDAVNPKSKSEPDPVDDGGLFTNKISGNLIRGMSVQDYKTGSPVSED